MDLRSRMDTVHAYVDPFAIPMRNPRPMRPRGPCIIRHGEMQPAKRVRSLDRVGFPDIVLKWVRNCSRSFRSKFLKASSSPIETSEFLSIILGFLQHDSEILLACAQVNRLWATEATSYLWQTCGEPVLQGPPYLASIFEYSRGPYLEPLSKYTQEDRAHQLRSDRVPSIHDLLSLSIYWPSRMQWYADKIRELNIVDLVDPSSRKLLSGLRFEKLEEINTWNRPISMDLRLAEYLTPGLRSLRIWEDEISHYTIKALRQQCFNLQRIVIRSHDLQKPIPVGRRNFLMLLEALSSISVVHVRYAHDDLVTRCVFAHLAERDNLQALHMGCIDPSWIPEILNLDRPPFHALRCLEVSMTENDFDVLSHHLPHLETLKLMLIGVSSRVLEMVARCRKLYDLTIYFANTEDRDCGIFAVGLVVLSIQCRKLRNLILTAAPTSRAVWFGLLQSARQHERGPMTHLPFRNPFAPDIFDATIEEVVQRLPLLERFALHTQGNWLTTQTLVSLGRHCRGLRHVSITANVDLEDLPLFFEPLFYELDDQEPEVRPPLFEHLRTWEIVFRHKPDPHVWTHFFRYRFRIMMPRLETLAVGVVGWGFDMDRLRFQRQGPRWVFIKPWEVSDAVAAVARTIEAGVEKEDEVQEGPKEWLLIEYPTVSKHKVSPIPSPAKERNREWGQFVDGHQDRNKENRVQSRGDGGGGSDRDIEDKYSTKDNSSPVLNPLRSLPFQV
ncbi:MAG: hypothetical protein M1819_001603 [Sarea resinae]|nr:MAG: hypothetical protein M1819_001603 [Sarea resinae]